MMAVDETLEILSVFPLSSISDGKIIQQDHRMLLAFFNFRSDEFPRSADVE